MTVEQFAQKQAEMTDKELIDLCRKQVSELAKTGGNSHKMTVPPMITDTDMLFSELIRRFNSLQSKSNTPSGVSDKIEEFIKENLPHANESFHYEAEAATALREFGEWYEVNPEKKFPGRPDPAEVNPYDSKGRNRLKSRR